MLLDLFTDVTQQNNFNTICTILYVSITDTPFVVSLENDIKGSLIPKSKTAWDRIN